MTAAGAYTPDTARMILEVVRFLKSSGFVREAGRKVPQLFVDTPVKFRNDSGAIIPPFGCLQVTGSIEDGGQNCLTVAKPADTTAEAGEFVFNGIREIAIGEFGVCEPSGVVRAITDDKAGLPGEGYRPIVDSFKLDRCPGPFMSIGPDDVDPDCIRVMHSPRGRGKARWIVATLNAEGTLSNPTVNDYWDGEDPESCESVTIVDPLGMPCPLKNEKVICCYRPESDDYAIVSTRSAMLGEPKDVEVMVDTAGAFRWSTGNCGEIEYATRTIKTFDSCDAEGPGGATVPKSIAWNGEITPVVVGASIQVNGEGKPCLAFTRAYALVCGTGQGAAEPLMLCGTECCDKSVHYQRFTSPNEVPPEATEVGEYDFEAEGSPLTDTVAEQCFVVGEAPAGWIAGSGELLGEGFTRSHPSPECCPPEEPPV